MNQSASGNQAAALAAAEMNNLSPGIGDARAAEQPFLHRATSDTREIPVLVIEPRNTWVALDLRYLWEYRELLCFLIWRDVTVRYKQTFLGAAWAIMQPLITMLIFTFFFGKLAQVPSDGIPYPLFAYAGLMPWMFFSSAITNSGNSLVGGAHLITKVYFPRMIIPGAAVLAGFVDLAIAFLIFAVLMTWYHVPLGAGLLLIPFLLLMTSILALGVGMWLSALNVKYRDIRFAIPFLIQIWMFLTPIIYPSSLMPQKYRMLYSLNPMTGIIEAFRVSLLGGVNGAHCNWTSLSLACTIAFAMLIYAAYDFRRMEKHFADLI